MRVAEDVPVERENDGGWSEMHENEDARRGRREIALSPWGSTSCRLRHRRCLSLASRSLFFFPECAEPWVAKGYARGSGKGREVISGEYRAGDLGIVGGLFPSCGRGARYWAPIPPTNSRTIQTMGLHGSQCQSQIQVPVSTSKHYLRKNI